MANYSYNSDTAVIKPSAGKMHAIFINKADTTPTIAVYDSSVVSGEAPTILNTFTPTAPSVFNFLNGIYANNGIRVEISGDVEYTVVYE